jgi:hypothetical protein
MNLREQELMYASLEGKHCAIDDDRDRGFFFMNMGLTYAGDSEYWSKFTSSYYKTLEMERIEYEHRTNSSSHSVNRI